MFFAGRKPSRYSAALRAGASARQGGFRNEKERNGASGFEDLLYSTHTYDAVVVTALKAESTDPSVYVSEVAGVTKGGTKCRSYAECRRLPADDDPSNDDIDYDGISGPLEIDETGDVGAAIFAVYTYDGEGDSSAVEEEVVKGRRDITVRPLSCDGTE